MFDWQELQKFEVRGRDDWERVANYLKDNLVSRQLVLLEGPMGVGKTELVRRLVGMLGAKMVSSPTFALHNHYEGYIDTDRQGRSIDTDRQGRSIEIDHWDLYRLTSEDELESSGFFDLFSQPEGCILVEWASRLDMELIPWDWEVLSLSLELNEDVRFVQIYKRIMRPKVR